MSVEGNKENDSLQAASLTMRLHCKQNCGFELECSKQYRKKVRKNCRRRINTFIKEQVYGKPQKKTFSADSIRFDTVKPEGKIHIHEGIVSIYR